MGKLGGLLLVGLMLGNAQAVWPCSPPYHEEVTFLTDDARWQSQGLQLTAESYDGKVKDYIVPGNLYSIVHHQMDGDGTVLAYNDGTDGFLLVDKRGVRKLRMGITTHDATAGFDNPGSRVVFDPEGRVFRLSWWDGTLSLEQHDGAWTTVAELALPTCDGWVSLAFDSDATLQGLCGTTPISLVEGALVVGTPLTLDFSPQRIRARRDADGRVVWFAGDGEHLLSFRRQMDGNFVAETLPNTLDWVDAGSEAVFVENKEFLGASIGAVLVERTDAGEWFENEFSESLPYMAAQNGQVRSDNIGGPRPLSGGGGCVYHDDIVGCQAGPGSASVFAFLLLLAGLAAIKKGRVIRKADDAA